MTLRNNFPLVVAIDEWMRKPSGEETPVRLFEVPNLEVAGSSKVLLKSTGKTPSFLPQYHENGLTIPRELFKLWA